MKDDQLQRAPSPRYRLYTNRRSYASALKAVVSPAQSPDSVAALERDLGKFVGSTHVICTPMARVAIYLVIKSLIRSGQEVILSPYTIFDVVNAVIVAGGVPVFADIDRRTCGITSKSVAGVLTPNTGAVMLTHLHGVAAETVGILAMCREHGVPVIEDAAQALGGTAAGRRLGTLGTAGIFSFGMYKYVNAWFGGAIVTDDENLERSIRAEMRDWPPMSRRTLAECALGGLFTDTVTSPVLFPTLTYPLFRYGALHDIEWLNRMSRSERDPVCREQAPASWRVRMLGSIAELVQAQIAAIDATSRARIERAKMYFDVLGDVAGVLLPPPPNGLDNVYAYLPIQVEERTALLDWLMRRRRDVGPQHLHNCADLEVFAPYHRNCPEARRVSGQVVLLPTYPRYPLSEARRTAAAVRDFLTS